MSEHDEQAAFFQWRDMVLPQYPILESFYAIPNGGKRHVSVARKLKAEGVTAGVLDTHLPVARLGYIGLWIEFKFGRNTLTPEQEHWADMLIKNGHRVEVCYTRRDAALVTIEYIGADAVIPF